MRHALKSLAVLALATVTTGHAATDSTSFKAKLTITESCTISATAPTDVDFGSQTRTTGAVSVTATGKLNVNCSLGTPYTIGLNGGLYAATPTTPAAGDRKMKHATLAVHVPYDLYQDAGHGTFWGNASGSWKSGTGTGASVAINVYGKLTSVNFAAGNYEDTVTATITY